MSSRTKRTSGTGKKLKIGDRVSRFPVCFLTENGNKACRPRIGTVTYIHPKHRFHTVEFRAKNGYKWRESYFGDLDIV